MSLPFLPGNSFDRKLGQSKHHLSHHFDNYGGVSMFVGEQKPGVGGEPLAGQDLRPKNSVYPRGEGPDRPAWVAFDKQVLCFDAYFQESVVERANEQYRIRKVRILFYLEDDTIQVNEARSKNAGYNQGTIIRRHRIPKPPPYDDTFFTIEDFNVQKEVQLYGKKFKLIDCDEFTRNFLTKLGVRVPVAIHVPEDPYEKSREIQDGTQNPLRPYERVDSLKQFLDHDRHVLRFNAIWDDRDSEFGEAREFIFHYFLADDSVEIREVLLPNSGRDTAPVFLHRQKLPKEITQLGKPGDKVHNRTVLNVIGNFFDGGRWILDNLKTGAIHVDYYKESDLMINQIVNVYGRKFLLIDCDEFTREFYKSKYGVKDFTPVPFQKREPGLRVERKNPPYTGFGSEEDSLASCKKMVPEPPKKDFVKWMGYDRQGFDSNILRFLARLVTKDPVQGDRRFIISFYLSDDTIHVYEPPLRNSGVIGGKFLERQAIKKPNQPRYPTSISEIYKHNDLYVGAVVNFNNFFFHLYDADEYCYRFMESRPELFPLSDANNARARLRGALASRSAEEIRQLFAKHDPQDKQYFGFDTFYFLLKDHIAGDALTEQEIITLARHYAFKKQDEHDLQSLFAVAQDHLRKNNFENFPKLKEALLFRDEDSNGFRLPRQEVRNAVRSMHLPLPDYALDLLLNKLKDDDDFVDYQELVKGLNWRESPVPHPRALSVEPPTPGDGANYEVTTMQRKELNINYPVFLEELLGTR